MGTRQAVLPRLFASRLTVLAAIGAFLAFGYFAPRATAGDGLGSFRTAVREGTDQPKEDDQDDDHGHHHHHRCHSCSRSPCCCDDDNSLGDLYGQLCWFTLSAPVWGPRIMAGDDGSSEGYFPRSPYAGHAPGYMMIDPFLPERPFIWSLRVAAEYGTDGDDLDQLGGRLLFEKSNRLGFDLSAYDLRESLDLASDSLQMGDVNLLYRFAQGEHLQMRAGIGMNWFHDRRGSDAGFNFTYGGDWFPAEPWVVSAEFDFGQLGESSLFHFRTTTGIVWHGVEVFTGYDYLDIGDAQVDMWINGVRLWF